MTRKSVLVLLLCAVGALAQDTFENAGVRVVLKLYDDCSKTDGFSPCLKKKAITFLDRLSRMDKFSIAEGVVVTRAADAPKSGTPLSEEQLEATLPRSVDTQDAALNNMLVEKVSNFIGSRTVEVALPKITADDFGLEEGRKGDFGGGGGGGGHGGGGGGGGGKKKGGNMMGGLMMAIAAKMAALIPIAIAGLFLLAGKALITAKIALLLSGIIAIKKLFAAKNAGGGGGHGGGGGGGGGHGGGWQSSGHGGGWQSSGGGWDKRSLDEAHSLAYSSHTPK